jgi:hypothetical protein
LRNIERAFAGWSRTNQQRACARVLIPLTPGGAPDINGWDTLPLFQGASHWLRSPPVYRHPRRGPCATPTSSDRTNASNFAPGHEDPTTCSNSVEFEGGCWLNGTVNYATFGVMVRLCAGKFTLADLARAQAGAAGVDVEIAGALGELLGTALSLEEWAEVLIQTYKALKGSTVDTADLPVAWVRAFARGGSSASPPGGANRADCKPSCALTGNLVRWDWVWEPVKPRAGAKGP